LPLELIQVRIGSEKSVLNGVLGVLSVPKHVIGLSIKRGEPA
jgi:hypothetical protein